MIITDVISYVRIFVMKLILFSQTTNSLPVTTFLFLEVDERLGRNCASPFVDVMRSTQIVLKSNWQRFSLGHKVNVRVFAYNLVPIVFLLCRREDPGKDYLG